MMESARLSRACIIKPVFHQFSPHSISGVIVIAESHFAIHTLSEFGYAVVDLFSCCDFDFMATLGHIGKKIEAGRCGVSAVERGPVLLHIRPIQSYGPVLREQIP